MSPLAYARRTISWAARRWSGSVVRMNRSGAIASASSAVLEQRRPSRRRTRAGPALLGGRLGDVHRVLVGAGQEARVVADHPVPARDHVRPDHLVQGVQAGLVVRVRDRGRQVVARRSGMGVLGNWSIRLRGRPTVRATPAPRTARPSTIVSRWTSPSRSSMRSTTEVRLAGGVVECATPTTRSRRCRPRASTVLPAVTTHLSSAPTVRVISILAGAAGIVRDDLARTPRCRARPRRTAASARCQSGWRRAASATACSCAAEAAP